MIFTTKQREMLAHIFADVAKGLYLAALAIPILSSLVAAFAEIRILAMAIGFTFMALKMLEFSRR